MARCHGHGSEYSQFENTVKLYNSHSDGCSASQIESYGGMDNAQIGRNAKRIRESKKLKQPYMAEKMGISTNHYSNLEAGKRGWKPEWVAKAAEALGVQPDALYSNQSLVQVTGVIELPDEISPLKDGPFVLPPPGFAAKDVACAMVKGDVMFPAARNGHIIYYETPKEGALSPSAVGNWCVCGLRGGKVLIKDVALGKRPGLYDLSSFRSPTPLPDQELEWASTIVGLLKYKG